jgi:tetratricopeptide (TPR) repeat protein
MDERTRRTLVGDYAVFRNALGVVYEDRADLLKAKVPLGPEDALRAEVGYRRSLNHFRWAAEWVPGDATYAYNTGNAYFHLGQLMESIKWYEKAVALDRNYTLAFFNCGVAALQTHQYAKAGDMFMRVLELKPDYAQAKQGLDYLEKSGFYRRKEVEPEKIF